MEPSFTLATLFWLFVPMPLLILFSLISLFYQMKREKKQKKTSSNLNKNVMDENIVEEKRGF